MPSAEENATNIATLQEQMRGLREAREERARYEDKRREFEDDVLQKLAVIIHQNNETCNFRKDFEAITDAQGKRINDVENSHMALHAQIKSLLSFVRGIGIVLGLAIAAVGLYKHG